tara:strand:- start:2930 stop:3658 length:729 start_codon:yes stop_codon:yes gene_type:complete
MRTDLSQYYHSSKPSVRLNYISTQAEKVNFTINGTDLLMRDFNIFCTTKTNHRQILEQLKQLAMTNNTTGASIFDLGNIIKADSIAEVSDILKDAEQKEEAKRQSEMQQQQQMQQQQLEATQQQQAAEREFKQVEAEKERQKDITVAEIRASGYGAMMDIDQNQQSDFQDAMEDIRKRDEYRDNMNFKREESAKKFANDEAKMSIEKEKLATQRKVSQDQLAIARENKNKYDAPNAGKKDKK